MEVCMFVVKIAKSCSTPPTLFDERPPRKDRVSVRWACRLSKPGSFETLECLVFSCLLGISSQLRSKTYNHHATKERSLEVMLQNGWGYATQCRSSDTKYLHPLRTGPYLIRSTLQDRPPQKA